MATNQELVEIARELYDTDTFQKESADVQGAVLLLEDTSLDIQRLLDTIRTLTPVLRARVETAKHAALVITEQSQFPLVQEATAETLALVISTEEVIDIIESEIDFLQVNEDDEDGDEDEFDGQALLDAMFNEVLGELLDESGFNSGPSAD